MKRKAKRKMATVNLLVKSKVGGSLATIYLRFRHGRETDIIVPTYLTVDPKNWSNKTQAYRQRMITPEYTEEQKQKQEAEINALKDYVSKAHSGLRGDPPTKEWLLDTIHLFEELQKPPKPAPEAETLNQYIERFIKEAEEGRRLCTNGSTKKIYSKETLRSFRDFQHSFDIFQGIYKEGKRKRKDEEIQRRDYRPLNFENITIDFYNDFLSFFYDRNCGANYIGKHVKSLKTIMRQAREEGLHSNNEIERRSFKAISEEVDNIYLTEAEIKALFDLKTTDKNIELARDVFLVGCYTAQRYSDYSRITKDNVRTYSGNKVVELIQQKTGEKCIIPIRPELDSILKKYDYTLPKTWEQKINERIKEAGALAGINEVIRYEQNKGGLTVKKKAFKYQLIKTHTARRSGCTNMYLAGIPVIDIMKISGHRTEKEFLKYIKVGKEQTAVNLASHPYFVGVNLRIAE